MRLRLISSALILVLALPAGAQEISPALGGATSRAVLGAKAFTLNAANQSADRQREFFFGNRLFNTNWVIAPASTETFDGVGPLFNRVACSGCHVRDGRGRTPDQPGEPLLSALVRVSLPGADAHGGPLPHPAYGDQIQDRAIPGVKPEARPVIRWTEEPGTYGDGTAYSLRRSTVTLADPAYGKLGPEVLTSLRVAPHVIGLGLLEAIPEADLRANADPEDRNGDGIRGRINEVWDVTAGRSAAGRFGWKANQPTLLQQNAGAFNGDMGLTTPVFPSENCTRPQKTCAAAPTGGRPEVSAEFLRKLTLYTQTIAVPVQRDAESSMVQQGGRLFGQIGCAACHTPRWQTGPHPAPEVAHQTIHPFTDLLLHDMGEGLADGRPDYQAGPRDWRTPPLWGLGLLEAVNGHEQLLHDGRARGFAEAILWHDGEAAPAKDAFRTLTESERAALLAFLRSL